MNSGVINVFKPKGMTSFDVVAILRKLFSTRKVGHGGTLDPEVKGVLPILINKATKISDYLHIPSKTYIGEMTLGIATDTEDFTGRAIEWKDIPNISRETLLEVFKDYTGVQKQVPPMVSAKKIKGKKLYEYHRKGIEIKREPNEIEIHSLELIEFDENRVLFKVECSKGTYIRSLIRDMALSLGTVGHMSYLIRTDSCGMNIKESISIERLSKMEIEERYEFIKPIDSVLGFMPKIDVGEEYYNQLSNGMRIEYNEVNKIDSNFLLYAGVFLGIGLIKDGRIGVKKLLRDKYDN